MLSTRPKQNFQEASIKCRRRSGSGKSLRLYCPVRGILPETWEVVPNFLWKLGSWDWVTGSRKTIWVWTSTEIPGVVSEMPPTAVDLVALNESWWNQRTGIGSDCPSGMSQGGMSWPAPWLGMGSILRSNPEHWHLPCITQEARK